jgi:uncharacterized membrane protein
MKNTTRKIAIASMLAALVCVATMIIKIPSPLKGYINLGDCVVLLSGWLLPPGYSFLAAGIGSALADVFSGYAVYAPITFAIKGLMAVVIYFCKKVLKDKIGNIPSLIIGGITAEILMIAGYYVFEGFMYGFEASLVNIPPNAVQGVAGMLFSIALVKMFDKSKIFTNK